MHIGHSLPTEYYMTEGTRKTTLESVQEETDLGVVVRSDLKSSSQCNKAAAAAAARRIIAMVRRNFKKLDVEDFLLIYKTYIRPRLEFCIHYSVMVSTFDKGHRNVVKSPEDSHKTVATVQKAQL